MCGTIAFIVMSAAAAAMARAEFSFFYVYHCQRIDANHQSIRPDLNSFSRRSPLHAVSSGLHNLMKFVHFQWLLCLLCSLRSICQAIWKVDIFFLTRCRVGLRWCEIQGRCVLYARANSENWLAQFFIFLSFLRYRIVSWRCCAW